MANLRLIASVALAGLTLACSAPASAQQPTKQAAWTTPRLSDGHPDLQGNWTNSSITVLERTNPGLPLVLSPEQAKQLEKQRAAQGAADQAPTSPDAGAPQAGRSADR